MIKAKLWGWVSAGGVAADLAHILGGQNQASQEMSKAEMDGWVLGPGEGGWQVVPARSRHTFPYSGFNFCSLNFMLSFREGAGVGGRDLGFSQLITCVTWSSLTLTKP